jgi:hypothetical protein
MSKVAEAFVEISAKTDKLKRGLRKSMTMVTAKVKAISRSILGSIKKLMLAITAVVAATTILSIRAWGKQEEAVEGLRAALAASGQEVDKNLERLKKEAAAIQKITRVGDEQTLELMQMAAAMGVTADQLDDVAKAAIGFAANMGQEVKPEMVRYIALAKQGEFTMLQRYVPAIRKATTQQQKMAELQRFVNEGWEKEQALAKTQRGYLLQLRNALGDVLEQFGRILTTGNEGESAMTRIIQLTNNLVDRLEQIPGKADKIMQWIGDRIDWLADKINGLLGTKLGVGNLFDEIQIAVYTMVKRIELEWIRLKHIFKYTIATIQGDEKQLRISGDILEQFKDKETIQRRFNTLIQRFRAEVEASRAAAAAGIGGIGGPNLGGIAGGIPAMDMVAKAVTQSIQTAWGQLQVAPSREVRHLKTIEKTGKDQLTELKNLNRKQQSVQVQTI